MDTKKIWLEKGYELFALLGPHTITINKIAKEINQTRTSFYYYFNNLADFNNELIHIHVNLHDEYVNRGKKVCKQYRPDIFQLISEFPLGLKFHRQLFNHRSNPLYNFTYMRCNEKSAETFVIELFKKYYKLDTDKSTLKLIHESLLDAWFSRLDINNLSAENIMKISDDIMESILFFINQSKIPIGSKINSSTFSHIK